MQTQSQTTYPSVMRVGDLLLGDNPRRGKNPNEDMIRASIRMKGVLQSILVRPVGDGQFEVRAGFTRHRLALQEQGEDYMIPVNVREMSDDEAEECALIENVTRGDMNPAEEAEAAAKILARCNGDRTEAAKRLGMELGTFNKRLALMNAVESVRDALIEEKIKLGHAELIAALPKPKQDQVLQMVLKAAKQPTVPELKAQIEKVLCVLENAVFAKDECAGCPNNTSNQSALFAEAVAAGNCTNRECFEKKTDEELERRKTVLSEEFSTVKIVRPGENFAVIKLVVDGSAGVGSDQAAACRACNDFGAAISATPGKVGAVYRDLCFNAPCNAEKVKAFADANRQAAEAANEAESTAKANGQTEAQAKVAGTAAAKKVKDGAKAKVSNVVSTRIKEYRVKEWRRALGSQLARNPELNQIALLAVSLSGDGRHINGTTMMDACKKISGGAPGAATQLDQVVAYVTAMSQEHRAKLVQVVAASVSKDIDEFKLVKMLKGFDTDLSTTWKIGEEFCQLLTKAEIEALVDEVGIKKHLNDDKALAKLLSGKKDDVVKKILGVTGFEYAGVIPKCMRWDQE